MTASRSARRKAVFGIDVGDCADRMRGYPEASFDAIVTDPPYGLEFMGKEWDRLGATVEAFDEALTEDGRIDFHGKGNAPFGGGGQRVRYGSTAKAMQAWHEAWACEALRVLKPGGFLLAFGGTRTYHRLASGIEDAGFEVRDMVEWLYGSGFPKGIDKAKLPPGWEGWNTALKPAHEPVCVARKPLAGTVAANLTAHGTGALNVAGCRVGFVSEADERESKEKNRHADFGSGPRENRVYGVDERARGEHGNYDAAGRWPANVVLDEEAAGLLDEQTGPLHSQDPATRRSRSTVVGVTEMGTGASVEYADRGGASRFFYVAKASRAERNAGLEGFEARKSADEGYGSIQQPKLDRAAPRENWTPHRTANHHPTVKPIALMRWLVRLVTPPDGLVLDPFAGSGTTGCACALEGFSFLGVERDPEYAEIARARIAYWSDPAPHDLEVAEAEKRERDVEVGQSSLLDLLDGEAA